MLPPLLIFHNSLMAESRPPVAPAAEQKVPANNRKRLRQTSIAEFAEEPDQKSHGSVSGQRRGRAHDVLKLGRYLQAKADSLEKLPEGKRGKITWKPDPQIWDTAKQFVSPLSEVCRVRRFDQGMNVRFH